MVDITTVVNTLLTQQVACRPATKGNLSPYSSLISVPDSILAADGDNANGYYFAIARKLDALPEEHALDSDGSQVEVRASTSL